jgi:lipopolysaccharide biosynthesis glycosyltransferase
MRSPLNIVFTIDKHFITHFSAALTSVIVNNKDLDLFIYVIHDMEDESSFGNIILYFKKTFGVELNLITLDNTLFNNFKISHHISKATYFRLLLSEILPIYIDTCLFLDSDIIVTGSLKELAEIKFSDSDCYLMAVKDKSSDECSLRLKSLGFNKASYFNAGVMLINLKLWRSHNVSKMYLEIERKYKNQLLWWDQDILNMYILDNWNMLDSKYNSMNLREKHKEKPIIIHYTGTLKPWHIKCKHPYKNEYFIYLKKRKYKFLHPFVISIVYKFLFETNLHAKY